MELGCRRVAPDTRPLHSFRYLVASPDSPSAAEGPSGAGGLQLKQAVSAPFRLGVRLNDDHSKDFAATGEALPGSRLALRRLSERKLDAPTGKRRDESAPPTKPSIMPKAGSPLRSTGQPALAEDSPLGRLERMTPTLTYGMVLVLAGVALGLGGLVTTSEGVGATWLSRAPGFIAASTLIFSLSMAVWITRSFARRLNALAVEAERLARVKSHSYFISGGTEDAVTSLARSLSKLSGRITQLSSELEQCVEEEQARVDELVRERTRDLAEEADDLRRVLGNAKGLLSVDRDGRILGQLTPVVELWLGAAPRSGHFWDYFDQAVRGVGARFELAWDEAFTRSAEPKLDALPRNLAVGDRYLALEYQAVRDAGGRLERVLVLLSDISMVAEAANDSRA